MSNGYQVIDLGGRSFNAAQASTSQVPGIYEKIRQASKPIVIDNYMLDGDRAKPMYAGVTFSGGAYALTAYTGINDKMVTFNVSSSDNVTCNPGA